MRSEQHRQHAKEHVVANDDVSLTLLHRLQQAVVLRRDAIDEQSLDRNSEPLESRRNVLQFGNRRENIPPIDICGALKRNEFRSAAFYAVAEGAPGQEIDLVAFGEQDTRDCKQRIEMARRRHTSDKNLHDLDPLIADRRAFAGLPTGATPSGAISGQPRSRPNGSAP